VSRVLLALNVNDIDEAVSFYARLFGTEPAKRRPGYANFAITEPPLKLVLLENPGQGGTLNHLGVEVADADAVDAEQARLAEAGLAAVDERDTTCCYARQEPYLLGPGQRTALGHGPNRTRRRPGRAGHPVLRRPAGRPRR
jgi:catechol 2,3-dioxygenase-like lactoylglutathione lyase family enzyme